MDLSAHRFDIFYLFGFGTSELCRCLGSSGVMHRLRCKNSDRSLSTSADADQKRRPAGNSTLSTLSPELCMHFLSSEVVSSGKFRGKLSELRNAGASVTQLITFASKVKNNNLTSDCNY